MIKRSVKIELGGVEREVKFTIAALEELESLLPRRNVFALLSSEQWGITDIISAAYCGLKACDRKISRQSTAQWVAEYAAGDKGIYDLRLRLLAAIGLSGLVGGEKSAFENILNTLDDSREEEADEAKK
ncbi:MAG: hypothetical protein Q4E64_03750 [Phascolarctobacterium sp.]|uniref:hypothetical protein n=1 Tax=Phascolarctobacterium sp. TaxID=2049039 RepID=UPI0026DDA82B|nr:hypothetical protein [Phascolarctobacterium sp.]MDO4920927.1 hypothetical protein [Phascolarctobacterium sp.]